MTPGSDQGSGSAESPASPLAEASPASLEELFSRNPWELSDPDFLRQIETLRAMRLQWKSDEAAGATKAKKPAGAKKTGAVKTTLEDLGL